MKKQNFEIGQEVVRTKGDYVVGRVGIIEAIDDVKNRVQVQWYNEVKTWISVNSIALTSIPYEIVRRPNGYPKYMLANG